MTPSPPSTGARPAVGGEARPGLRERKERRTRRAIQLHTLPLIDEQGYAAPRLGRSPADPEARVLGGAPMGGLIALLLPSAAGEEVAVPRSQETVAMHEAGLSILATVATEPR